VGHGRIAPGEPPGGRGHRTQVFIDEPTAATRVLDRVAALGYEVIEFRLHPPGLQDVFLELTGRELRD